MSACDFVTLSWVSGFEPLSLWRLLDAHEAITNEGAELLNVNGLLNLVAWSRELEGHLVPHGELEDGFVDKNRKGIVVVRQNALRNLRYKVSKEWSPRRVFDSQSRWVRVRRLEKSNFEEDAATPLYASEEDIVQDRLRAVYVAPRRPWWIEIGYPDDAPRNSVFEHWKMLCVWLGRAAPVLDDAYPTLPKAPITFYVDFSEIVGVTQGQFPKTGDIQEFRSLFNVSLDSENSWSSDSSW
jgi:hypothetical protein